jgi:SAM-dependent methyltransferase
MPDLKTTLHLDMLKEHRRANPFLLRLKRAVKILLAYRDFYGLEWGDPEVDWSLRFLRDRYARAYVNPSHTALEIGPGGGRWTRYLLGFGKLYVVDYYPAMFKELKKNFSKPNMVFVLNHGTDFPGVPEGSIDFLFSFDCFVHLEADIIDAYLKNIFHVLKPGGNAVIHYSDKTKVYAQVTPSFSENTPEQMRRMVVDAGFRILEEDLTTMPHGSIIRFTR